MAGVVRNIPCDDRTKPEDGLVCKQWQCGVDFLAGGRAQGVRFSSIP